MSWNKFIVFVGILCAIVYIVRMNQPKLSTTLPFLDVISPVQGSVVTSTVHVVGRTNAPYVTIKGVKVQTKGASFEYDLPISVGTGIVYVVAENNAGRTERNIMVSRVQ